MLVDVVLEQLNRRKLRTSLAVIGIGIGILLIVSLSSFSEGMNVLLNTEMSLLSGKVTLTSDDVNFMSIYSSRIPEDFIEELEDLGDVDSVVPIVFGSVPDVGSIYGLKINQIEEFGVSDDPKEGRLPYEGEDEVFLGSSFADLKRLSVGDTLTIRGKEYDIVGVGEKSGTEGDDGLLMWLDLSQEILKTGDYVSIITVIPKSANDAEVLAKIINEDFDGLTAYSDKDAARESEELMGQFSTMTFLLGSIAAIIAGIGIMNVMFMSVNERRKEIGTMKALGATTREVLLEFMLEAVIITLIGEALGIGLSFLAVGALNSALAGASVMMNATITVGLLFNVTLFVVILAIFAGILPAREAAGLDPAKVLRYE